MPPTTHPPRPEPPRPTGPDRRRHADSWADQQMPHAPPTPAPTRKIISRKTRSSASWLHGSRLRAGPGIALAFDLGFGSRLWLSANFSRRGSRRRRQGPIIVSFEIGCSDRSSASCARRFARGVRRAILIRWHRETHGYKVTSSTGSAPTTRAARRPAPPSMATSRSLRSTHCRRSSRLWDTSSIEQWAQPTFGAKRSCIKRCIRRSSEAATTTRAERTRLMICWRRRPFGPALTTIIRSPTVQSRRQMRSEVRFN